MHISHIQNIGKNSDICQSFEFGIMATATNDSLEDAMLTRFRGAAHVSVEEIITFLHRRTPSLNRKTIQWRIHDLTNRGIIQHISRGVYSFIERKDYVPSPSPTLKRMFNMVRSELPYATFCVWETRWFNEFMTLQIFKNDLVVDAEKDVAELVHEHLVGLKPYVFYNPGKDIFDKYIFHREGAVIVRSMVSEAPTLQVGDIVCASLEKLLIDCLADTKMFSAQQEQLDTIYENAFKRYKININAMRRYASRRNRLEALMKQLKTLEKNDSSPKN
jgi:hypothetical protein